MELRQSFNVTESGVATGRPIVFVHGFGCDQSMWRWMRTHFEQDYRVLSYDLMGLGGSDKSFYEEAKYRTIDGYAVDLVALIHEMELRNPTVVGHSVGSSIAMLAAARHRELLSALVMLVPTARYIDEPGYTGGFSSADIDDLLDSLERNFAAWASTMAPLIMGRADRPELGTELTELFCQADPAIAATFAGATFRADNREDLGFVTCPTLVVACRDDFVAPPDAVQFVADGITGARLVTLDAAGHCPNLSEPDLTAATVLDFLETLPAEAATV